MPPVKTANSHQTIWRVYEENRSEFNDLVSDGLGSEIKNENGSLISNTEEISAKVRIRVRIVRTAV